MGGAPGGGPRAGRVGAPGPGPALPPRGAPRPGPRASPRGAALLGRAGGGGRERAPHELACITTTSPELRSAAAGKAKAQSPARSQGIGCNTATRTTISSPWRSRRCRRRLPRHPPRLPHVLRRPDSAHVGTLFNRLETKIPISSTIPIRFSSTPGQVPRCPTTDYRDELRAVAAGGNCLPILREASKIIPLIHRPFRPRLPRVRGRPDFLGHGPDTERGELGAVAVRDESRPIYRLAQ